MKSAFPLILTGILFQVFISTGTAQVKSGGFLGFKKKGSQVSGDLFPDDVLTPPAPSAEPVSSPVSPTADGEEDDIFRKQANGIFRGGAEPIVQHDEKKGGFVFPFGKKKDTDPGSNSNLIPVPVPPPVNPPREATQIVAAPAVEESTGSPKPMTVSSSDPGEATPAVTSGNNSSEEPVFETVEGGGEERGSVFSFFSWKDKKKSSSSDSDSDSNSMANTNFETDENGTVIIKADPDKLAENRAKPGSVLVGNEPRAEEASGGLFSGITKPKVRKKKTADYSNFETVMENGEFVNEDEPDFSSATSTTSATPAGGEVKAPQVIDGVKTYSTWDQVGGRSVSAAEKILQNAR